MTEFKTEKEKMIAGELYLPMILSWFPTVCLQEVKAKSSTKQNQRNCDPNC